MIDRDELVDAIAEGRNSRTHHPRSATADDLAEAGRDLDALLRAHRAEVLREAADIVGRDRAHIHYGSASDYADRHSALLLHASDTVDKEAKG